jgi:hypothetical protein
MAAEYKLEVLRVVEASPLPVSQALRQLGIPRSSYYRWRANIGHRGRAGLYDRPSSRSRVWNQILPGERDQVLRIALLYQGWSPREVRCLICAEDLQPADHASIKQVIKAPIELTPLTSFRSQYEARKASSR